LHWCKTKLFSDVNVAGDQQWKGIPRQHRRSAFQARRDQDHIQGQQGGYQRQTWGATWWARLHHEGVHSPVRPAKGMYTSLEFFFLINIFGLKAHNWKLTVLSVDFITSLELFFLILCLFWLFFAEGWNSKVKLRYDTNNYWFIPIHLARNSIFISHCMSSLDSQDSLALLIYPPHLQLTVNVVISIFLCVLGCHSTKAIFSL